MNYNLTQAIEMIEKLKEIPREKSPINPDYLDGIIWYIRQGGT